MVMKNCATCLFGRVQLQQILRAHDSGTGFSEQVVNIGQVQGEELLTEVVKKYAGTGKV